MLRHLRWWLIGMSKIACYENPRYLRIVANQQAQRKHLSRGVVDMERGKLQIYRRLAAVYNTGILVETV